MINVRVAIYCKEDFDQATEFCFLNKIDFTYQSFNDVGFLYIHNMPNYAPIALIVENFDTSVDEYQASKN